MSRQATLSSLCVGRGGGTPPLFVLGQMPLSRYVRIRAWEGIQGFPINKHIDSNPAVQQDTPSTYCILHISYSLYIIHNLLLSSDNELKSPGTDLLSELRLVPMPKVYWDQELRSSQELHHSQDELHRPQESLRGHGRDQ